MELKPGYKQTEVGVIPEDWAVAPLGYSIKLQGGYSFKSSSFCDIGVPVIRISNVQNGCIKLDEAIGHPEIPISEDFVIRDGDALIAMSGATTGKVGIYRHRKIAYQNQRVGRFILRDKKQYSISFIQSLVKSEFFRKNLSVFLEQGAQPNISSSQIESLTFAFPPTKAEQEAIAEALSDADDLIESLEQLIAKKRLLKQGAMQELLTGKRRLPGFSGEWVKKTLAEVCWFQEGPGVRTYQFTESGVKLLNGTNIVRGMLDLSSTSRFISKATADGPYAHFLASEGDLVIASSGITIDRFHEKVAFVRQQDLPVCMNTSTIRFRAFPVALDIRFLFQFLMSSLFKRQIGGQATGSAQLNFGPSHVEKVEISLPEMVEQTTIASVLSDMDADIAELESKLSKARIVKQGMMQELLTGRIRLV